jgi:DNA-binding CsgD family transcriptional regulator
VPPPSPKETLVRRLALEKVRELRRMGLSYREIGLRFGPQRGVRRGPLSAARSRCGSALPHNSVGARTTQTADHELFVRALDALPVGLVFFDRAERPVHANARAIRMLSKEPGGEQIRGEIDRFARTVCDQIRRQPRTATSPGVQELGAREFRTGSGNYRLRGSYVGLDLWGVGGTVLIALEPMAPEPTSPEEVRQRFGLTRKEAQVALLLAERRSTPEIARELYISPHTARHHVRQVLAKLGIQSRKAVAATLEAGLKRSGAEK